MHVYYLPLLGFQWSVLASITYPQVNEGPESDTALPHQNFDWDYYVFAQRFHSISDETCQDQIENLADSTWVIHGLWPTKLNSDGPNFCSRDNATSWSLRVLEPILSELQHSWPNLLPNSSANSFWEYEWRKHGTCFAEAINGKTIQNWPNDALLKFFVNALALRNRIDLDKVLRQFAGLAGSAVSAGSAESAESAVSAESAGSVESAGSAESAVSAESAESAESAGSAGLAGSARSAEFTGFARFAGFKDEFRPPFPVQLQYFLRNTFGHRPTVKCAKARANDDGKVPRNCVEEIRFCFSKEFKFIDCPDRNLLPNCMEEV
ncbi:hypothetical protein BV898_12404 [Hypsibius exemplaris]|uniref:Uncharacterized protein n=1 Tax=Hypsibius exemplaris TaxID=2072580 RepID=A0A1W0WDU8_HYPEX|nr:hypothetical protein BV898_12404 [Hypsibius exemplaris]